jgi:hypothetical protein
MSATAAPFGLRPVGNLGGSYNGSFRQYPSIWRQNPHQDMFR